MNTTVRPRGLRGLRTALAVLLVVPVFAGSTSPPTASAPDHVLDPTLEPLRWDAGTEAYEPRRSPFPVVVDGEPVGYDVMAVVTLPGAAVPIEVGTGAPAPRLRYGAGRIRSEVPGRWVWTAPAEPGVHALRLETGDGSVVHLNALVAYSRADVRDGSLHGYAIGRYLETPLRGNPVYLPPEAFVEVSPADEDILLAPHFTLGQFLCKQPGERRFVSLSLPLVRKLEAVLEATNEAGIDTPTFHVMSGFRTPAYNRAIGNTTDYSRHLWGDAADIFVDVDGNGDMDDLDGNGRSDLADAQVLYGIVDRVEQGKAGQVEPGGLGLYRRNAAHGPFVHVDARGAPARW